MTNNTDTTITNISSNQNSHLIYKNLQQDYWHHFFAICNMPHPSKHEQAIKQYIKNWATQLQGIDFDEDNIGNLLLRKAAHPQAKYSSPIALQAHLDMVCQSNTPYNFLTQGINYTINKDWIIAPQTTLGADNGIGVALALAILQNNDLILPAIEVLLTVDEEAGMSGALNLRQNWLKAQYMLNLDTEEWGSVYIGCAGSQDLEGEITFKQPHITSVNELENHANNNLANNNAVHIFECELTGLMGGHSGLDIALPRGNAIATMIALLQTLNKQYSIQLHSLNGGTARNAIARQCKVIFATNATLQEVQNCLNAALKTSQLLHIQPKASMEIIDVSAAFLQNHTKHYFLDSKHSFDLLQQLSTLPHGVYQLSKDYPDTVQTSCNFGLINCAFTNTSNTSSQPDFVCHVTLMARSLSNTDLNQFTQHITQNHIAFAWQASTALSAWTPNKNNLLLNCFNTIFTQQYQHKPTTKIIHAGLECGVISQRYPLMHMISFGPTILGAHAPGERVQISSTNQCWHLLVKILEFIANNGLQCQTSSNQ